jgi:hypothetical protein
MKFELLLTMAMSVRGVQRALVEKLEEKRSLGRPRCTWEDNIKIDLQDVGGGCGG